MVLETAVTRMTPSQRRLKRGIDLLVGGCMLLCSSPIFAALALAIKLDSPGPIFHLQDRIGEGGKPFKLVKFRTMIYGADRHWQDVIHYDSQGNVIYKSKDDPRITRIGHFLRRTSLDELPNLLNVMRGELSLVGPRPELPYIVATYEPWQWQRFSVPAGMTGWWQVNGRSDKPMHLHTQYDLYYIENYSIWLDLLILLRTVGAVVKAKGAF